MKRPEVLALCMIALVCLVSWRTAMIVALLMIVAEHLWETRRES